MTQMIDQKYRIPSTPCKATIKHYFLRQQRKGNLRLAFQLAAGALLLGGISSVTPIGETGGEKDKTKVIFVFQTPEGKIISQKSQARMKKVDWPKKT